MVLAMVVLMSVNPKSLSWALLDVARPSKLRGCEVILT